MARKIAETLPMLDIEAVAKIGVGEGIWLRWDLAGEDTQVGEGHASISKSRPLFTGESEIVGSRKEGFEFETVARKNGFSAIKIRLYCNCSRAVTKVYFMDDEWACRYCHNLTYQSSLLSPMQRDYGEYLKLKEEQKRPSARHQRLKKREERFFRIKELEERLQFYTPRPRREIEGQVVTTYERVDFPWRDSKT